MVLTHRFFPLVITFSLERIVALENSPNKYPAKEAMNTRGVVLRTATNASWFSQKLGCGITFGVQLPIVAPGMPNEEELAEKTAREFVENYGALPVAYLNYGGSELLYKYVYKYSRIALAGAEE